MPRYETATDALAFVRKHGVVLASAKGSAPNVAEAITGAPIRGSWWAHPQGKQIFAILGAVAESEDVLVCRLVEGKRTFVHRRLWPALVRVAARFAPARIARVGEQHTATGRHVTIETPFPQWVPVDVATQAKTTDDEQARSVFWAWMPSSEPPTTRSSHRGRSK